MLPRFALTALLLSLLFASGSVSAYFNSTYLATTIFLSNSTSAHVVESINLYVSNASVYTYDQDRQALNSSLGAWRGATGSQYLVEHVLNPKGSISNFTFIPGPIVPGSNGNGYASLTMSYDVSNVTSVLNIAPRKFEYAFNASVFNFLHTSNGQNLLPNTRLTIAVPSGSQVLAPVSPPPDYPQPNLIGHYNSTTFAWFSGESLQSFSFIYIVTETPQQEVVQYFGSLYRNYAPFVYLVSLLLLAIAGYYVYIRVFG